MEHKNYTVYINQDTAKKIDRVFAQMQKEGLHGRKETPDGKLAIIIAYALDKTIEGIEE